MVMERVTVEQHGERFTLEVPEGTSDDQIKSFIGQQNIPSTPEINAGPQATSIAKNMLVTPQSGYPSSTGAGYSAGPAAQLAEQATRGGLRDAAKVAGILYNNATPATIGSQLLHPIKALQDFGSAYVEGHPWANTTMKQAVQGAGSGIKNLGGAVVGGLTSPESLMALPYQAAAYEQAKIRMNPNAPEYANNPFAQSLRSQATTQPMTQGQAGAMNQRSVVANQQYGGLSQEDQDRLTQDRLNMAIRLQAAKKILGQ